MYQNPPKANHPDIKISVNCFSHSLPYNLGYTQQVQVRALFFIGNSGLPHHSWRTTQPKSFAPAIFGTGSFKGISKLCLGKFFLPLPGNEVICLRRKVASCSFTVPSITAGTDVIVSRTWTLCYWFDCWKKPLKPYPSGKFLLVPPLPHRVWARGEPGTFCCACSTGKAFLIHCSPACWWGVSWSCIRNHSDFICHNSRGETHAAASTGSKIIDTRGK